MGLPLLELGDATSEDNHGRSLGDSSGSRTMEDSVDPGTGKLVTCLLLPASGDLGVGEPVLL
jgi:hypothetical protein